jgi:hypothetical protein
MSDPIKRVTTNSGDQLLHADIAALIKRHLTPDTPERVLAIAAQVVGQVIALQDQRTMTNERVWQIVLANIEAGNQGVIDRIHNTKGNA